MAVWIFQHIHSCVIDLFEPKTNQKRADLCNDYRNMIIICLTCICGRDSETGNYMLVLIGPQWSLDFKTEKLHYTQFRQQLYFKSSKLTSLSIFILFLKFHLSLLLDFWVCLQIKLSVSKMCMRYITTLSLSPHLGSSSGFMSLLLVPINSQSANDNHLSFFFIFSSHTLLTISTYSPSYLQNLKCKDLTFL